MKTLYVITESNWNGSAKYVFDQATTRLKYPEARVGVVLKEHGELSRKLEKAGVQTHYSSSLLKLCREEKPNTLHLNSFWIGFWGACVGRFYNLFFKQKTKIIFTAHGWKFNEERNLIATYFIKFISYLTVLICDEIIVFSKYEQDQVSRWRNASKKIRVEKLRVGTINFLTREEARVSLISYNPRLAEHANKKWLGTIAELHHNKGLIFGVEAIQELRDKNIIWVIIGEGQERSILQKQILDANLYNKIFLLGHISNAPEFLRAFDAFILPSIKESLPHALLEAEQAKLPIIATNTGGITEYLTKSPHHIVERKNSQALVEAIKKVV